MKCEINGKSGNNRSARFAPEAHREDMTHFHCELGFSVNIFMKIQISVHRLAHSEHEMCDF